MMKLPTETANRLQKVLSKRLGRILTESELEEAYDALLDFAFSLVDFNPDITETHSEEEDNHNSNDDDKMPLAFLTYDYV